MPQKKATTGYAKPWLHRGPESINGHATIQGTVVEYKVTIQSPQSPGGKRGTIKDFSPAARLRMLKEFHKIDFASGPSPLFMTLTYPDPVVPPDLKTRNLHRKLMARHLERITRREVPAAWRIEWQDRKSGERLGEYCPHWHWLIFGHTFIDYRDVNESWKKTIGFDGYTRTEIERVDKTSAISLYMAKYISKDCVSPSLVMGCISAQLGRQFGWLRKSLIPMQERHAYRKLTEAQRDAMKRLGGEQSPYVSGSIEQSFTLFGTAAEDARRILDGEALDG